jgi:hypothetical protein
MREQPLPPQNEFGHCLCVCDLLVSTAAAGFPIDLPYCPLTTREGKMNLDLLKRHIHIGIKVPNHWTAFHKKKIYP